MGGGVVMAMEAMILIPCTKCGSEGRLYVDDTRRWDLEPRERDDGECPVCEGTGMEEIETFELDGPDDEYFELGFLPREVSA